MKTIDKMQHMSGSQLLFMQTNDFYGNVLVIHANRSPSKQKFSGPQHLFKQMCGTASFVDMSSLTTLVQQAEAGGRNEKNLHKRKRGSLFSGRTHAGSLLKHILLDSTFLTHQNPFRIYTFVFMLSS